MLLDWIDYWSYVSEGTEFCYSLGIKKPVHHYPLLKTFYTTKFDDEFKVAISTSAKFIVLGTYFHCIGIYDTWFKKNSKVLVLHCFLYLVWGYIDDYIMT